MCGFTVNLKIMLNHFRIFAFVKVVIIDFIEFLLHKEHLKYKLQL